VKKRRTPGILGHGRSRKKEMCKKEEPGRRNKERWTECGTEKIERGMTATEEIERGMTATEEIERGMTATEEIERGMAVKEEIERGTTAKEGIPKGHRTRIDTFFTKRGK
jgi:hypothetical protein